MGGAVRTHAEAFGSDHVDSTTNAPPTAQLQQQPAAHPAPTGRVANSQGLPIFPGAANAAAPGTGPAPPPPSTGLARPHSGAAANFLAATAPGHLPAYAGLNFPAMDLLDTLGLDLAMPASLDQYPWTMRPRKLARTASYAGAAGAPSWMHADPAQFAAAAAAAAVAMPPSMPAAAVAPVSAPAAAWPSAVHAHAHPHMPPHMHLHPHHQGLGAGFASGVHVHDDSCAADHFYAPPAFSHAGAAGAGATGSASGGANLLDSMPSWLELFGEPGAAFPRIPGSATSPRAPPPEVVPGAAATNPSPAPTAASAPSVLGTPAAAAPAAPTALDIDALLNLDILDAQRPETGLAGNSRNATALPNAQPVRRSVSLGGADGDEGDAHDDCEHCRQLEEPTPDPATASAAASPRAAATAAPATTGAGGNVSAPATPGGSRPGGLLRIGQRGKATIVAIEQKVPGQYIHGSGETLFIDVRREDGTITSISLRSSPTRCKTDLIEALNLIPEHVLLRNWRYFSVLLAKVDQSKPFKRLATESLILIAKRLRELNPDVNTPPAGLMTVAPPPPLLDVTTSDSTAPSSTDATGNVADPAAPAVPAGCAPNQTPARAPSASATPPTVPVDLPAITSSPAPSPATPTTPAAAPRRSPPAIVPAVLPVDTAVAPVPVPAPAPPASWEEQLRAHAQLLQQVIAGQARVLNELSEVRAEMVVMRRQVAAMAGKDAKSVSEDEA
ncbi:hypothetical protein AMAG_04923 [Allomyces macrogynus ATCC 38327]|uniref:Uncharacterized protein n=1 Tax=Allomyces macrogynus (strain ATCC 38327) TaxID=578462 RepID=A0A0L0S691_ALLM3|nr:hypothetical protein AMAG_04923 [Allomyces macrogynus ATCC 38327]|eukprot:KNE58103.1 hypothetical protein AMAG_04923 [Allomyces macrogynus ATCC 38327]